MCEVFNFQLVLRYGISFCAGDASAIVRFIESEYPSISTDVISAEGSNIVFSFDSDKKPMHAMLFVEKLTIGTEISDIADSLAVDFSESDLTAWRTTYIAACSVLEKIFRDVTRQFPEAKITLGWKTHVCVWKVDSDVASQGAASTQSLQRSSSKNKTATAPHPKKTSHGRNYSVGSRNNTVRVIKK